ncbi:toxin VasX [Marinobacter sp.]|uniref:toxin VasX n=1 Tax=Marinobacter sp. TaxID=50741 RepID=UPI002B266C77|nr:toxin VasX [Marinobacter sp.]
MTDTVDFVDESRDRSILRKAEYDDADPKDLVLTVPKRDGGKITIPLQENARSSIEREDYQENTLLRVKPLAEIADNLPVKSGGLTINQGKGVALLRPGYLYIFRKDRLWRELEINENSRFSDIDLAAIRIEVTDDDSSLRMIRPSSGDWLDDVLMPVFLQGQAVMSEFRMAYSEVQWDWSYIEHLEQNETARIARTTYAGSAWAAASIEGLKFSGGFPASRIEDVAELRVRDLGVELMLENPSDFGIGFDGPAEGELCAKLGRLLEAPFDMSCEPGEDQLTEIRKKQGVACLAISDPLFTLRHSMSQLHLALHYLDAVDVSIQSNPMVHSAMLIRQAVFDPVPRGQNPLARYASAVDRSKLDQVLKADEKHHAINVIDRHLAKMRTMLSSENLDVVLEDYRTCNDVAICEGYLLAADTLNLLQQIPGVLRAQGVSRGGWIPRELRRWFFERSFLSNWAPETAEAGGQHLFESLERRTQDTTEIDEELLKRLNLQSLVYLEKQLNEQNGGLESGIKGVANAGKVSGMIAGSLNEWSSAVLTVGKRLMEENLIKQVELQRVMQGALSNFALVDPSLKRIDIMSRAEEKISGAIIGVSGNGVVRGLTDFDRTEGVLTRSKDYLYADLLDDSGRVMASTSPARMHETIEEAIRKVGGTTAVFVAPDDHPEVRKLSLVRVNLAKRINEVVDGPAVSRGLVVLAGFNVFLESHNVWQALRDNNESALLSSSKLAGAFADLAAASLKLSEVVGYRSSSTGGAVSRAYQLATRPLFDMKNWILIGNRLRAVRASTLIKVAGLATFIAGAAGAGLSFWEMRISLSSKDFDAATGHAIAMTGSLIVLASPLMHTLLAIPGWGWAIFGLAMAVGGGLYAASATDDAFEQLLKRGPWGTHPDNSLPGRDDKAYYSQLLALLSPIQVTAQRYEDVEPDSELSHPDYRPKPDDYVITVQLPLISRIRLHQECQGGYPSSPFRLVVQEVAYLSSTTNIPSKGLTQSSTVTNMLKATPLTKVTARQSLPQQSAVRFLVRREIQDSEYQSFNYQESVETRVRVGLQVTLGTELGPLVFPAPVFEDYEAFDLARHSQPPPKERTFINPYGQPKSPYWYFTEVSV